MPTSDPAQPPVPRSPEDAPPAPEAPGAEARAALEAVEAVEAVVDQLPPDPQVGDAPLEATLAATLSSLAGLDGPGLEGAVRVAGARVGAAPAAPPQGQGPLDPTAPTLEQVAAPAGARAGRAPASAAENSDFDAVLDPKPARAAGGASPDDLRLDDALRVEGGRLRAPAPTRPAPQGSLDPDAPGLDALDQLSGGRLGAAAPADEAAEPEEDPLAKVEKPARPAPAGASPIELYGHPTREADPRGDGPPPDAGFEWPGKPATDAGERLTMGPVPQGEGPSKLEAVGQPTAEASERVPLRPGPKAEPGPGGGPAPSTEAADRLSLVELPAALKEPSPIEGYGQPTEDAGERVPLRLNPPAEVGPGGGPAPSTKAADRLSLVELPAALKEPSPLESYGRPAPDAAERVPLIELPAALKEPSPLESMGSPGRDASERVVLRDQAPAGEGPSPIEGYGQPARASTERVALVELPAELGGPSPLEGYGRPAADAAERLRAAEVGPGPAAPSPLESMGQPGKDAAERVILTDEAPAPEGPSAVEGYGQPSRLAADRLPLVEQDEAPAGPSPLEGMGSPSQDAAERVILVEQAADPAGPSPLEGMGSPSQDAAQRVILVEQAADPAGPSLLEGMGSPSQDASERVILVEQPATVPGPSLLEGMGQPRPDAAERVQLTDQAPPPDEGSRVEAYGHPARDATERVQITDQAAPPDEGSRVEAYGHPARDAAERVQITDQAPAPDEGSRVEAYGHPARDADERIAMRPDAPPAEQTALEGLGGAPRTDAAERVEVSAGYIDGPSATGPLEGYRDPSGQKIDRVDLHPDDEPAPNDTLGALGAPSARRADRLRRVDAPEDEPPASLDALGEPSPQADDRVELFGPADPKLPASTMEQAAQASRQRGDRVGAPTAEELAIAAAAAGELRLSTQREDRLGRPDDQDLPPSTLTGIESRSLMEAGRLTAREHRPAAYDNPNGLDAVMPHAGLRGVDRMRMPEADEDLPVDPALIGRVPVMPEEIELWGDLPPNERVGACGEPRRRLGERTHHRLDFRFQRYELLTVRRAVYDCPLCPDEEPVVATSPRFLAGGVPVGNGLLAQLVVARFGDHGNLSELANSMSRYGLVIEADKLDSATRKAAAAVQPIIAAIRAEVNEAKRVHIDARGLPTRRPGPQRDIVGELFCVSADDQLYWAVKEPAQGADPGCPDPTEGAGGRKVREGEVAWNLLRDKLGWSREGRWGGLRHRLTVALITDPQRAAYGLFLVGALGQAAGPSGDKADLATRQRALKTWLDEQQAAMDSPSTAMARAVSYALQLWPQLRYVDEAGRPVDEGEPRRFPKAWTAQWDLQSTGDREALTTWCTLIGCCRRLGLRPWEYLYELFEAVANDALRDPAAWTPRAWAKASGA